MATFSVNAGATTQPIPVGKNTIVTVTPASGASALVQYTTGSDADIKNGVNTWVNWPNGTVTGVSKNIFNENLFVRCTATTGAVTFDVNTAPSQKEIDAINADDGAYATYSLDINNNIIGLVDPRNGGTLPITGGGTHLRVACLGDSITARTTLAAATPPNMANSAVGFLNWANWLMGAPLVYSVNLGVSGDVIKGIAARVVSVPKNVQLVTIMAGTNDVNNMSSVANQATIDSTYTAAVGFYQSMVTNLVSAGKKVLLCTIIPNNAFSSSSDSRIQLLDRLNVFIKSLASANVLVADTFAAIWDSTQPTLRVATTGYLNADGIHPTNAGCQLMGNACTTALKTLYGQCIPDIDIYEEYQLQRIQYNEFRRSTGGTAGVITNGTGTLADGWRSINQSGTPTFTIDATQAYTAGTSFIGSWASNPAPVDSFWQIFTISSAINGDIVRLRLPANTDLQSGSIVVDSIYPGSFYFMEIEIFVVSATNLAEVSINGFVSFTSGTSPADQPAYGTTSVQSNAASTADSGSVSTAIPAGYRAVIRTPAMRVPENINGTVALQYIPAVDMKFIGAGSATIQFARPRLWHKCVGRLG